MVGLVQDDGWGRLNDDASAFSSDRNSSLIDWVEFPLWADQARSYLTSTPSVLDYR